MVAIRRLTACVLGLLVLQLSLVAGASPCGDTPTAAEAGHAGMPLPAEEESCSKDAAGNDCAPSDSVACQAMLSCVTAVLQGVTQSALTVAVAHDAAPTDAATLLQTRSTVPDLPPPRA
jgi:hypothetical protein